MIYGIIAERRRGPITGTDLLSRMMQSQDADANGEGMSDRQLRDEVITLLSAGHETTATTLAWTWYLLARHPEIESRLAAELQSVLGGRAPTAADVPRLQYVEQIVMESMRLYPPVFAMGRMSKEPCEIGGFDIPTGTSFLMSQWVSHRDPRYFDSPEEFRPERWADDRMRQLPKFAYFPFGGGPRLCIGAPLAMLEAVLIVATVAQAFRFELVADQKIELFPSVTLRPRNRHPGDLPTRRLFLLRLLLRLLLRRFRSRCRRRFRRGRRFRLRRRSHVDSQHRRVGRRGDGLVVGGEQFGANHQFIFRRSHIAGDQAVEPSRRIAPPQSSAHRPIGALAWDHPLPSAGPSSYLSAQSFLFRQRLCADERQTHGAVRSSSRADRAAIGFHRQRHFLARFVRRIVWRID